MNLRIKRLVAKVMAVVLALQFIGCYFMGNAGVANAATDPVSGLPVVNEEQVTARVKELARLLGVNNGTLEEGTGIMFTANGKACGHATSGECDNCCNENVIKSTWFRSKFGYTVDVAKLPGHYQISSRGTSKGWTCYGFVNFALWYIAKNSSSSDVYRELIGTQGMAFTYSNLKKYDVRIGDVIRSNNKGHSFMFLGYVGTSSIKVLDCNWVSGDTSKISTVKIHTMSLDSSDKISVTRASNYEPGKVTLPVSMTSPTGYYAKLNLVSYAKKLEGFDRTDFINAGRTDIPSGDWCTWFIKLCATKVGIGSLVSSKTTVASFCTDMIKNYGATAYYYKDSKFLTSADKTVLSGAKAVTKGSFTPQVGDIYILHESGFSGLSQVGIVTNVVNGYIYAVVGNNGTAKEVQLRESTTNTFYKFGDANSPIVGYIRPNYSIVSQLN